MGEHAKFSPSAAHRWIPCPGSLALSKGIPNTTSKYADEGTAAHILASRALEYKKDAVFFLGEPIQPRVESETYTVDEEMVLNVQVYLDDVRGRVGTGTLLIEQKLTFSDAIGQPDQFGTGDAVIINGDTLIVEDLKYGQGVQVYAKNNEQIMLYALGALEKYEPIIGDDIKRVIGVVCQPRLDHIDEHEWTVEELRTFAKLARVSAAAAVEAMEYDDPETAMPDVFQPGDKQCRWCPAAARCQALARKVSGEVFDDFEVIVDPTKAAIVGEPRVPAGERLSAAFGVLNIVENWARAVRAEAERQVMGGMTVIGEDGLPMKVIEGKRGNRYWAEEHEQTVEGTLTGLLGPEKAYKPRKIVTPSVAQKSLGKRRINDWKVLEQYVRQEPGKPKIALGSDPSPPFSGGAEASEFSNVETETE